jgi:hypothetical protein
MKITLQYSRMPRQRAATMTTVSLIALVLLGLIISFNLVGCWIGKISCHFASYLTCICPLAVFPKATLETACLAFKIDARLV